MTEARALVPVTRFALLRSGFSWPDVDLDGLELLPDGRIELRRLPQVSSPTLDAPSLAPVSGLAFGCDCTLLAAGGHALVRLDPGCDARDEIPLDFAPAGVALGPRNRVYVADPAGGRIVVLDPSTFEQLDVWTMTKPTALAADDERGLLVVDDGAVTRLDREGRTAWTVAGNARVVAVGRDGTAYVGRNGVVRVARFDRDGNALPPLGSPVKASSLAVDGDVLYVANAQTGEIVLLSVVDGRRLGAVVDFVGPVAALAVHAGTLALARGDGDVLLAPRTARTAAGSLRTVAPLDAGLDGTWLRVAVEADVPPATDLYVDVATPADPADAVTWRELPASAALIRPGSRFQHVRVRLERRLDAAPGVSPSVAQLEARTASDTLLDRLPASYARAAGDGILVDLLAFAQAELDDLEAQIADLPRRFSTATGEPEDLDAVGRWQSFSVPADALRDDAAAGRSLLEQLPDLYANRGTLAGVARYVEAVTGARPQLFEFFRTRSLWALGADAGLGIGTRLAPATLDGLVVGTAAAIGEATPDDEQPPGGALFEETAHRFTAIVPAASAPTPALQMRVRRALAEERPAHADFHLCFAGPDARVGIQARVGVDAIVAAPAAGNPLDGDAMLGVSTRLAATPVFQARGTM